jgi:quercetin dioxygenase-like cupin family protein
MTQIEELEALTQAVINAGSVDIPFHKDDGMQTYDLEQGTAMAFKLLKKPEIAVADSFLSKGTIFPLHNHDISIEVLFLYKGKVTLITEKIGRKTLKPGDFISITKGDGHALLVKEDSWIVAITMPAEKSFPG